MLQSTEARVHCFPERSITVCMTAFNEEAVVSDTIHDCLVVLHEIPGHHEILIVNDGSTDHTGRILQELSIQHAEVRVLTHKENRGFTEAQRWLIQEAAGDLIFHFAADGEWKASELHRLLKKLHEGYDIVIGVRRKKHYSPYRLMVSWFYNIFVTVLFRKNFHDIGSIRLARSQLWKRIPAKAKTACFIAEKLVRAYRNQARIGFVPVDHTWRSGGRSKLSNPLRALEAFVDLCALWFSPRSRKRIDLWSDEVCDNNNQLY